MTESVYLGVAGPVGYIQKQSLCYTFVLWRKYFGAYSYYAVFQLPRDLAFSHGKVTTLTTSTSI
jgi:hypothetical protein